MADVRCTRGDAASGDMTEIESTIGGDNATGRPRLWPFDVAYVALALAIFHDAITGSAFLVNRDLPHYFFPIGAALYEAWNGTGSFLWDSGVDQGLPMIARWSPAVFYPTHVLFAFMSAPLAVTVGLVIHLPLGASATLRLARRCVESGAAAWIAGAGYGFGGYMLSMLGGGTYLYGAALLPLSVLGLVRLLEAPSAWRTVQLGAITALQVFAADPQTLFYEVIVVYPVVFLVKGPNPARMPRPFAAAAAALALGAGLSCCQWLGVLEMASLSLRSGGMPAHETLAWSFHPLRLVELAVPLIFGGIYPENTFWARSLVNTRLNIPWAAAVYCGLLPLLALWALKPAERPRTVLAVGAAAAFFLFLAFGSWWAPSAYLLAAIPGASYFRYPEKFMLFASLCLCILGALGIDRLWRDLDSPWDREAARRLRRTLFVFACFGLAVLALRLRLGPASLESGGALSALAGPNRGGIDPAKAIEATTAALDRALLVTAAFAAVLALGRRIRPAAATVLLAAVCAADVYSAAVPMRVMGGGVWTTRRPFACEAMPPAENGLKPLVWRNASMLFLETDDALRDLPPVERQRRWQWDTLKANVGTAFCVRYADGYDAGRLGQYVELWRAFGNREKQRFDLFGVEFLIAEPGRFDTATYPLKSFSPGHNTVVFENRDPLPYARPVSHAEAAPDGPSAIRAVSAEGFPFRERAVFETRDPLEPCPDARRSARVDRFRPGGIRINTDFALPGYLVVNEAHYPGWKASVDGEETRLFRANGAFMGVAVPAGNRVVELSFDPPRQKIANSVSLASAVLAAAALAASRLLRRTSGPGGRG
ncbi:MAG: YfhO family protein [Deltaproteobacteria bacterium]|nr:YfhO family protein [Deltaproteobacteria bacterium]